MLPPHYYTVPRPPRLAHITRPVRSAVRARLRLVCFPLRPFPLLTSTSLPLHLPSPPSSAPPSPSLSLYATGTMERVVKEGQVATASTLARLFSNLPRVGKPVRVMVYDLHTLQNRFYLRSLLPSLFLSFSLPPFFFFRTTCTSGSTRCPVYVRLECA
jgi:hypothetical protein